MKRGRNPDLIEQWIRRGVLLASEMRKHGVVMKFQLTWEPVKRKGSAAQRPVESK